MFKEQCLEESGAQSMSPNGQKDAASSSALPLREPYLFSEEEACSSAPGFLC